MGLVAVTAATGCGQYARKLRRQEAVAIFQQSATQQQHLAARAACSNIPHVIPEPLPRIHTPAAEHYDVRFRVDDASLGELGRLSACLREQPGVIGLDLPENM